MRVLVTGGAGYIGATISSVLADAGHSPVIIDDLSTGRADFVRDFPFYEADYADESAVGTLLDDHPGIEAVIHCAGLTSVPGSRCEPERYHRVNVAGIPCLLASLRAAGVHRFIFSSSAAVYGDARSPVGEDTPLAPRSPYAHTKVEAERILADAAAEGMRSIALRYFNPIGADPALRTGMVTRAPEHVVGCLMRARRERRPFVLAGDDWPTRDGSALRDYVHVWDLARAHVAAVERFDEVVDAQDPAVVVNLGTGNGTTVRELFEAFRRVAAPELELAVGPRRPGDTVGAAASCDRARRLLGWQAELGLDAGIADAISWQRKQGWWE